MRDDTAHETADFVVFGYILATSTTAGRWFCKQRCSGPLVSTCLPTLPFLVLVVTLVVVVVVVMVVVVVVVVVVVLLLSMVRFGVRRAWCAAWRCIARLQKN